MTTVAVSLGIELVIALLTKSTEIAALINKIQSEGRTEFTLEEWSSIISADDIARQNLLNAIAAKIAERASIEKPED